MDTERASAKEKLSQIVRFAKEHQNVEALGLGGSWGMKREDNFADLDLFFLVDEGATKSFIEDIQNFASNLSSIIIESISPGSTGFGIMLYQVMYDDIVCDIFIDTRNSLKPHPLRKNSCILVDKTGYYTSFIASVKSDDLRFDVNTEFDQVVRQFWFDSEKTYRAIRRNHMWNALYYLNRLRIAMFRMIRLSSNKIFIPDKPFKYFEIEFSAAITKDLEQSLAIYTPQSIQAAYQFTIQKFRKEAFQYAMDHDIKWYIQLNEKLKTISLKWIDDTNMVK